MIGKIYICENGYPKLIEERRVEDIQEVLEWENACIIEIFDEDTHKKLLVYVKT